MIRPRNKRKKTITSGFADTPKGRKRGRESILATMEILCDFDLTNRLVALANSNLENARLYTMSEVFETSKSRARVRRRN